MVVEKTMRFSVRDREEMESFLTDSVKSKLDFFKELEDLLSPTLFNKNISYVVTMSPRLIMMIDQIIDNLDMNTKGEFSTRMSETMSQV